jgi:hypothetical protein
MVDGMRVFNRCIGTTLLTVLFVGALSTGGANAQGSRTYIDEHNRLVVDGEPFFPLGWYAGHNVEQLREIAAGPFNCVLDYGINGLGVEEIRSYLDTANALGMKIIYCMNDLYPSATYHKEIGPWKGNEEIAQGIVSTFRTHPSIIAWYANDERPIELVPEHIEYYNMFARLDPNHPVFIVHFSVKSIEPYLPTTDIMGVDVYPIPRQSPRRVRYVQRQINRVVAGRMPVWMVLQAFAWYQYRDPENPDATGGRGRTPTAHELEIGRAPTYDEERCMTYLALVEGAKALIYYCYYDLRVLPQYEEMWGWMKKIGGEVRELSPILLSTEELPVQVVSGGRNVHAIAKRHDGRLYLIAVNSRDEAQAAEINLDGRDYGAPAELFTTGSPAPRMDEHGGTGFRRYCIGLPFPGRRDAPAGTTVAIEFKPLEARVFAFDIPADRM